MKNYGRPDRRIDRMERHLAWFDRPAPAAAGAIGQAEGGGGTEGGGDFRASRWASPPTVRASPGR